jgi:hypothetical protein
MSISKREWERWEDEVLERPRPPAPAYHDPTDRPVRFQLPPLTRWQKIRAYFRRSFRRLR